jgi:hypothetical protein
MKKTKFTNEDLLKRIENLERVIWELEAKKVEPNKFTILPSFVNPPPPNIYHYHNGIICYQNPCVWC